eukprot:TRINITY_DN18888_c0_g1_i1.p1 TRINITY_DN18888_c0_g1~~TRINITY_DN18888_c0_g1_i1.p1  ORF type:complete len:249 (-),score=26.41 TRINITY_DN18888_c0_g1_i1:225-971(-)
MSAVQPTPFYLPSDWDNRTVVASAEVPFYSLADTDWCADIVPLTLSVIVYFVCTFVLGFSLAGGCYVARYRHVMLRLRRGASLASDMFSNRFYGRSASVIFLCFGFAALTAVVVVLGFVSVAVSSAAPAFEWRATASTSLNTSAASGSTSPTSAAPSAPLDTDRFTAAQAARRLQCAYGVAVYIWVVVAIGVGVGLAVCYWQDLRIRRQRRAAIAAAREAQEVAAYAEVRGRGARRAGEVGPPSQPFF